MPNFIKLTPDQFPERLREIPEPPKQLYVEGTWPGEDYSYLTVVGSRKFSRYGQDVCEKLISELAGQPIVIVSGLAIGIDTLAHQAALAAQLITLGVPGSGLDRSVLHPSSNRRLADEIVAAGGALLSELDPTQPAGTHTFPRRNRIMAGLSDAILVIEAGEKSGTLITARLATEYNRELLAVPGSIFSPSSRGANSLIKLGATPVMSGRDVLEALGLANDEEVVLQAQQELLHLSTAEQLIVDLLTREPLPRDILIAELDLPVSEANTLLAMMEIKGLIKESLGELRITF
jgi:DNA processing protein